MLTRCHRLSKPLKLAQQLRRFQHPHFQTTKSIHKFCRGDDSAPSSRKVVGIYDMKTLVEPPPKPQGATRFVCISDTHEKHHLLRDLPMGDVLLHAGDFTRVGDIAGVKDFNSWLGALPHQHKVVIAGNHDLSFEPERYIKINPAADSIYIKNQLKNCTYLEDSEVVINGIRIYGSPYQPEFGNWAFNLPRGRRLERKWSLIPQGIDVLLTHGPPLGYGDLCYDRTLVGCEDLLKRIRDIRPVVHVCGHVHEARGVNEDENTVFINASSLNLRYDPVHASIVFDVI